jgi:rubrerythrin
MKKEKYEEDTMRRYLLMTVVVLLSLVIAVPVTAQYGPGWRDDYGWDRGGMMGGRGYGMGPGMMGYPIAPDVPDKLPAPKSQEWMQKLRDVLDLERLSYDQYMADAEKFNAYMPYMMVIPQEEDHIRTIERLFAAYGLPSDGKSAAVTETKTIIEAFELCAKMEQDLIQRYEWLVKNAADRDSAGIINSLLLQTRHHLVMFDHALRMGGRMGPGMMYRGDYGYGMGPGYGRGYGMGPGMMREHGYGYGMGGGMMGGRGYGYSQPYSTLGKPLELKDAKALMEDYIMATRNPNLKIGKIRDKGDTFEADIVTKNNALVDKVLINKQTGRMSSAY